MVQKATGIIVFIREWGTAIWLTTYTLLSETMKAGRRSLPSDSSSAG